MAIIPQMNLFSWTDLEELGDLDRLRLVIEYLPDEKLMEVLEKERRNGQDDCPVVQGIRIPLKEDRRIFTPIDRSSYKWEKSYNKRTAVERVNSRLDVSFGFENHTIRGMKKMRIKCGLALCIMLAMALGRIKENQPEKMRSLVS